MGDTRYSYDANGNRIGKQDQEGLSRYRYNQDNFLSGFDDPEGKTTDYGYDAMNRRIYKAAGEKEKDITSFLYDGLEVLQEIGGENSQKIVAYYRANGRIVTRQEYNVSQGNDNYQHRPEGQQLFYSYDGLGSVVALSNHQGKEKTRYHYDAFGKVIDGDLTENQYTFTGRQLDPESGLYHFHFRQYDSQAGVWTTPDPIGVLGGVNLYGYVSNNPVNFRDFLGLSELSDVNGGFADNGGNDFDSEGEEDCCEIDCQCLADLQHCLLDTYCEMKPGQSWNDNDIADPNTTPCGDPDIGQKVENCKEPFESCLESQSPCDCDLGKCPENESIGKTDPGEYCRNK